ncbi:MAG TPA: hypothetical protein VN325_23725 [Steroidobacteraceae bacterium]|nr:hypothetical protein [Steroidobacteraceae bacterium]
MTISTRFTELVGIKHPIVQGGMMWVGREAVLRGLSASVEEAMVAEWEHPAMKAMLASVDFIEGPLAFAEKRAPRWKSHTP